MKYIQNGRAKQLSTYVPNIRDIVWTSDVKVFLYDWEHHAWIDPDTYDVSISEIDRICTLDHKDDYNVPDAIKTLFVSPKEGFPLSKKILVYLGYYSSHAFDAIENHDATCDVRLEKS